MSSIDSTWHWLFRHRTVIARGWRTAPPSRLRAPAAWSLRHAGLLIAIGGGLMSAVGYLQVGEFAEELGARPADLDVPTSTYVAGVGLTLFVFGAFLLIFLLGGRAGVRLAPWWFGLHRADIVGVAIIVIVAALAVGGIVRLATWAGPPEVGLAAWVSYVLGFTLLTGAVCGVMSALVPKSAPKRWLGWSVLVVMGAMSVGSAVDDDAGELARATRRAAVTDQPAVASTSALALVIRPAKGTVTLADGTTFCAVRVGDRVFVRPSAAAPDVAETVVQDARNFVSPGPAC